MTSGAGSQKGRTLITTLREKTDVVVKSSLGQYGFVSAISGNLVAVRRSSDSGAGAKLLARIAGPVPSVGDMVAIFPMDGGGYVAALLGVDTGTLYVPKTDVSDVVRSVENSASSATTSSTTNTATAVDAISVTITLPAGTWSVLAHGSCAFATSVANGRATTNMLINGVAGAQKNSPLAVTANVSWVRGVNSDVQSVVLGVQTVITCKFQYFAAQASTVSANNPQIIVLARRTA